MKEYYMADPESVRGDLVFLYFTGRAALLAECNCVKTEKMGISRKRYKETKVSVQNLYCTINLKRNRYLAEGIRKSFSYHKTVKQKNCIFRTNAAIE